MFPEQPKIIGLDHLVLTVADPEASCRFYEAIGFERRNYGEGRVALHFGTQKINLHTIAGDFKPRAGTPAVGTADLCFLVAGSLERVRQNLADAGMQVIEGPVRRTGATGPIDSLYLRDPDGNLLELSVHARA